VFGENRVNEAWRFLLACWFLLWSPGYINWGSINFMILLEWYLIKIRFFDFKLIQLRISLTSGTGVSNA
jgi:hypothetical protein